MGKFLNEQALAQTKIYRPKPEGPNLATIPLTMDFQEVIGQWVLVYTLCSSDVRGSVWARGFADKVVDMILVRNSANNT